MENNARVFKIVIDSLGVTPNNRKKLEQCIYELNSKYAEQNIFLYPCIKDSSNDISGDILITVFVDDFHNFREYSKLTLLLKRMKQSMKSGEDGMILAIGSDDSVLDSVYEEFEDKSITAFAYENISNLLDSFPELFGHLIDKKILDEKIKDEKIQDEKIKDEIEKKTKFRSDVPNQLTFFEDIDLFDSKTSEDNYRTFQTVPYFRGGEQRNRIKEVVDYSIDKLKEFYLVEEGYWTDGAEDNEFHRTYVTSSVLTYLFQLGVYLDNDMVKKPLVFLKSCDAKNIYHRSAFFFLAAFQLIEENIVCDFIDKLIEYEKDERGVIILPQEQINDSEVQITQKHWTKSPPKEHKDGASFHACHISDHLLHMNPSFSEAKKKAAPLVNRLKDYIQEEFVKHNGFFVRTDTNTNTNTKKASITLYGYAISPALGITLPDNWLDNVKECKKILMSGEEEDFKRCLGVMNFAYMSRMSDNKELKRISKEYIDKELEYLWDNRETICTDANNTAVWARAFVYGYESLSTSYSSYYFKEVATQVINDGEEYL